MESLTVGGAYGRDYKSKKAVLADWNANKDFQILNMGPDCGRYLSKSDTEGMMIHVRYNALMSITSVPSEE